MSDVVLVVWVKSATNPDADTVSLTIVVGNDPVGVLPADGDLLTLAASLDFEPMFGPDYASTVLFRVSLSGTSRDLALS